MDQWADLSGQWRFHARALKSNAVLVVGWKARA